MALMARVTDTRGRAQPMERDPDRKSYMVSHVLQAVRIAPTLAAGLAALGVATLAAMLRQRLVVVGCERDESHGAQR